MNTPTQTAAAAASWALSKKGCEYSQPRRLKENVFDCSSLVARAYIAQGVQWLYGGPVPLSMQEVYSDCFELLWPGTYSDIGKKYGGRDVIAERPGPAISSSYAPTHPLHDLTGSPTLLWSYPARRSSMPGAGHMASA